MLYIANCTRQHLKFHYRVPEKPKLYMIYIPSGCQDFPRDSGGWSKEQTAAVIEQLEKCGAKEVPEIGRNLTGFSGIVFSTKDPISEETIEQAHEVVLNLAQKRSVDSVQKAARTFDLVTRENFGRGKRLARETSVEIIEEVPPGEKPSSDAINFKHTVSAEG